MYYANYECVNVCNKSQTPKGTSKREGCSVVCVCVLCSVVVWFGFGHWIILMTQPCKLRACKIRLPDSYIAPPSKES